MSPKEIPDELIDRLLAGREGPEAITGPDGLLKHLTKRVVERAASAELSEHLGYELGEGPPEGRSNRRNGSASKTLIADQGSVPVELPRDGDGSFEPQIVPKHQRRFAGFLECSIDPDDMTPIPGGGCLLQISDYGQHTADILLLSQQMQDSHG